MDTLPHIRISQLLNTLNWNKYNNIQIKSNIKWHQMASKLSIYKFSRTTPPYFAASFLYVMYYICISFAIIKWPKKPSTIYLMYLSLLFSYSPFRCDPACVSLSHIFRIEYAFYRNWDWSDCRDKTAITVRKIIMIIIRNTSRSGRPIDVYCVTKQMLLT